MDFTSSSDVLALLFESPSNRGRHSTQASPTLSIPQPAITTSASTFGRTPQLHLSFVEPLATSRGFHRNISPPRVRPQQAKTAQVGFLHLPKEVRFRIYELAIYDHDRTAVFLPRNHPRKVEPGLDDVDLVWAYDDKAPTDGMGPISQMYEVGSVDSAGAASGVWIGTEDLDTATRRLFSPAVLANEDLTDQQILNRLRLDVEDERDLGSYSEDELDESAFDFDAVHEVKLEVASESDCSCICPTCTKEDSADEAASDVPIDRTADGTDDDTDDSEVCKRCDWDSRDDEVDFCACRKYCGEHQLQQTMEEADEPYGNDDPRNVFKTHENVDGDDYEHFDTDEDIGILYEPLEPSILLASKQVRAECLPVYFAQNAFSWRFQWTTYAMSSQSFKSWTQSIDPDHLKLMNKITFEGRHVVEEGIEFSIDIDLLDEFPYFETNVYGGDTEHGIAHAMNREAATYLWLMSQSERSRPVFTSGHLCALANIFVQAMHRDAGGCMHENATTCRMMLNPLF